MSPIPAGAVTITYEYNLLYRPTEANYLSGDYYHYTYDPVVNRLTQAKVITGLLVMMPMFTTTPIVLPALTA